MDRIADLFADFGAEFGLSRPAGKCLGTIWRADTTPCADDLTASLGLSRSNVSTALKELRAWSLISVVRHPGDRKEYFAAPDDPWELVLLLVAARRQRVIVPALERLLRIEARRADVRALPLHDVVTQLDRWLSAMGHLSPSAFARAIAVPIDDNHRKKKKKKKN